MINEKISKEISGMMEKGTRKISVIITVDSEKNIQNLIDKMKKMEISADLSIPEPIPIIACSLSPADIHDIVNMPEIKKIEYDGKTYAL